MKRAIQFIALVVVLTGLSGCVTQRACCPRSCDESRQPCCRECGGRGCRSCRGDAGDPGNGLAGGAVAYPYYTTRGPRDFLDKNPQSIGP
jgi:hypothetical protein